MDDEYYSDEPQFLAERSAFERAGVYREDVLGTLIGGGKFSSNKLEELNKRLFRLNLSKREKFNISMAVFFDKLAEFIQLGISDLDSMMNITKKIDRIEYKNPIAFILGYYVSEGGSISEDRLGVLVKSRIFSRFDEVALPDVVRYARLILNAK